MDFIRQASGSNVGRMFATQARLYPNTIALDCNDEQRTYAQLNERINQLAHVMLNQGVGLGERVGLLARNCIEYWRYHRGSELAPVATRTAPFHRTHYAENANCPVRLFRRSL